MRYSFLPIWLLCLPMTLFAQGVDVGVEDYRQSMQYEEDRLWSEQLSDLPLTPLRAYPSIFASLSDYNFAFVRYRRRGYAYRYRSVSVNQIDLDDPLTGSLHWSLLRAVRNVPGVVDFSEGILPGETALGWMAGVWNYQREAAAGVQRGFAGVSYADRKFRFGMRGGYRSGVMKNGWAVEGAFSRRWGRDASVRGVYTDDWTVFTSVSRRLGKAHTLTATFLMAPGEEGVRGAATQEAFSLTGDRLYNPYWGEQGGRLRAARVRKNEQPLGIISWEFEPDKRFRLQTSFSYLWGESSYSGLDWYDASNPTPDYYRSMPGYIANPQVREAVTASWREADRSVTQINWDELYAVNRRQGSDPAAYVVGSDVSMARNFQLVSNFEYRLSDRTVLLGGLNLRNDRSIRFRRLDDLLEGNYLLDVDPYLIDDQYYGDRAQNDLQHPDRRVGVGERYDYHYAMHYAAYGGWFLARLQGEKLRGLYAEVGANLSQVNFSREGYYEKELYPGNESLGPSGAHAFTEYQLKALGGYAFSPSHHLELRLLYGDRAPLASAVFLSAQYQNRTITSPRPVTMLSGELCYRFAWRALTLELNGYATSMRGESDVRHYYDDLAGEYAHMALTGVDKFYAGVELGALLEFTPRWSVRTAASWATSSYASDPHAVIYADHDGRVLCEESTVFLKGYALGVIPRYAASGELRYAGAHMWTASVSVNFAGGRFIDPAPVRRMYRALDYAPSAEARAELLEQERFGDATSVDLYLHKTFRIGSCYLSLNGSVRNLFNRRNVIYSGYESMRLLRTGTGLNRSVAPMDSRYYYAYPRTFYLTVNLRF